MPTIALRMTLDTPMIAGASIFCHGNEISKITLKTMKRPKTIDNQTTTVSAIREASLFSANLIASRIIWSIGPIVN